MRETILRVTCDCCKQQFIPMESLQVSTGTQVTVTFGPTRPYETTFKEEFKDCCPECTNTLCLAFQKARDMCRCGAGKTYADRLNKMKDV